MGAIQNAVNNVLGTTAAAATAVNIGLNKSESTLNQNLETMEEEDKKTFENLQKESTTVKDNIKKSDDAQKNLAEQYQKSDKRTKEGKALGNKLADESAFGYDMQMREKALRKAKFQMAGKEVQNQAFKSRMTSQFGTGGIIGKMSALSQSTSAAQGSIDANKASKESLSKVRNQVNEHNKEMRGNK